MPGAGNYCLQEQLGLKGLSNVLASYPKITSATLTPILQVGNICGILSMQATFIQNFNSTRQEARATEKIQLWFHISNAPVTIKQSKAKQNILCIKKKKNPYIQVHAIAELTLIITDTLSFSILKN